MKLLLNVIESPSTWETSPPNSENGIKKVPPLASSANCLVNERVPLLAVSNSNNTSAMPALMPLSYDK